ncbi:TatD family hydrolase [Cryptosporangium phraense]|uniref:Amidohydrolase family protein n=1 Tax=Cryptosporangium phraense TaxID=2593070 RepID=A0A545AWI9_9ACTN|nr:TatD family hydrolase [Cryptosporangium phraense]TQS45692.1 amidohydrolase family protein [Cryptosporangium phraense]
MSETRFDTVVRGGTVLDHASGLNKVTDLAIKDGKIAEIGDDLAGSAAQVVDATGAMVMPGLVEGHTHIFEKVSKVGAPQDEAHLRRGVVAAADAGTAGASTFPAFRTLVVEPTVMRIVNFLNVSVLGLIDFRYGELINPDTFNVEDALKTAADNPDVVRGFKIRLSEDVLGDRIVPLLEKAIDLGEQAGLPVMVHIGETALTLPEILERLRPGDIIAHCYTGKENGILDENGAVLREVYKARERGVMYDSAHGKSNMSFKVAKPAIAEGFLPDILSSDTSGRNWRGPVFDLVTSMSKFLALGVPMSEILPRVTTVPAKYLGLDSEGYGSLTVGGPAHVTVLKEVDAVVLPDAAGNTIEAPRLEPTAVFVNGVSHELTAWRGNPEGQ